MLTAIVLLSSSAVSASSYSGFGWHATTPYPTLSDGYPGIYLPSCVSYSLYIYCVGGADNNFGPVPDVNYARLSFFGGGISAWKGTTPYPRLSSGSPGIVGQSCVEWSGYIYCVGGYDQNYVLVRDVDFAHLSPAGVGAWQQTTSYPLAFEGGSCAVASGYIYCVGGYEGGGRFTNAVYYAKLSSSGVGTWQSTTSYPTLSTGNQGVAGESCLTSRNTIYCIAGEDNTYTEVPDVYYAQVSSSGVGAWQQSASSYPLAVSTSCTAILFEFVCVGGFTNSQVDTNAVYFAFAFGNVLSPWFSGPSYPFVVDSTSCAGLIFTAVCVGGASVTSPTTGTIVPNVNVLGF